jgi:prepilin-type N-terminal cleavage/methylation domain-containing protein
MSKSRGFTLIELVIVCALIGIVAVTAIVSFRAATRNANVGAVAWDLALKLQGQRAGALADQRDRVILVVDAPGNDASDCSVLSPNKCAEVYSLRPAAGWKLTDFDPADREDVDGVQDYEMLPKGVRLHLGATNHPAPKPFGNPLDPSAGVRVFDADLTGTCGGRTCFAIRFRANGEVEAERAGTSTTTKRGFAFAVGSELTGTSNASEQKGVVLAFPTGIVKAFPL